jgi:hypothetical protein
MEIISHFLKLVNLTRSQTPFEFGNASAATQRITHAAHGADEFFVVIFVDL